MDLLSTAEKQLITTLAWFRSRYALYQHLDPERKATRESIEAFGKTWIGEFKQNWDDAFASLQEKGVLIISNGEYAFTGKGVDLKNSVEAESPFYQYEYDNYFSREERSEAHRRFCEKVYGKDLSQHGLIDLDELALLIDRLKTNAYFDVLDLGCGNGRITEYLSGFSNARFLGVDISGEAIAKATKRVGAENEKLRFRVANINDLDLPAGAYDLILSLDTLYYADSLPDLLDQASRLLRKGGRMMAYFSQWIMDENYAENLQPENTHLARALSEKGHAYTCHNLTESGINHWKTKLAVLEEMEEEFAEEGNRALWEYRYREAYRYANWGDNKYSRYFYEIEFA